MKGTPQRILAASRALFAERGYRATSMQAIADQVGITKAALYYHFASKDEILRELTLPLLNELEAALADAEAGDDPQTVRWNAIEGYIDVYLRHRDTLVMLIRDMTLLVQAPVAQRFVAAIALANDLVCGPDRSLEGRVRASQVVAALGDPIVLFKDVPSAELKQIIIAGARALLANNPPPSATPHAQPAHDKAPAATDRQAHGDAHGDAGGGVARGVGGGRRVVGRAAAGEGVRGRPRGRSGGRPAVLGEVEMVQVRELYAAGQSVEEIAERFGVSRATVYRCLKT